MPDNAPNNFHEAMVEFVQCSEELCSMADNPRSKAAFESVCRLLGIARLELVHNIPDRANRLFLSNSSYALFGEGEFDESRPMTIVKLHEDGCVSNYYVYPRLGLEWSAEEKMLVNTFVSAMYIIHDRIRIATVAEKYSVMDNEMELFNLRYFMKCAGELFARGEIRDYCACRFNIAQLSVINAKLGRNGGTRIMTSFVYALRDIIGEDGFISRLGGDNFISLFKKPKKDAVIRHLSGVSLSTELRGIEELFVSAHAGYFDIDETCRSPVDIMEAILIAEIASRSNRLTPYSEFNEELKKRVEQKKLLESLFFDAVDKEEFLVYYQPKVNLTNYTISGAEALCRWRHNGELVPPVRFIPILEQSHNICVLDFYMLEHVCRDMRKWIDDGLPLVKISVNLSRMHLGDEKLAERITAIIDKYDIPHKYIEIELTETTTDVDFRELKKVVSALHNTEISTSVDDFGVGYSSLNLIRDLPWNVLKIDKSFLPEDSDDNKKAKRVMLKYVISMAQELGLECIVEGVESPAQVELLKNCSCFRAQGFLFDKPLPVEVFTQKLREGGHYMS